MLSLRKQRKLVSCLWRCLGAIKHCRFNARNFVRKFPLFGVEIKKRRKEGGGEKRKRKVEKSENEKKNKKIAAV